MTIRQQQIAKLILLGEAEHIRRSLEEAGGRRAILLSVSQKAIRSAKG